MNQLKKPEPAIPAHETLAVGLLLSMVGGFLESYTYLLHGGVFANAQTGNLVLMAVSFATGNVRQALFYPTPILAFVLGILISTHMCRKYSARLLLAWEPILVGVELALLFGVGLLPRWVPSGVTTVTVSFLCSMQYNTFRKVGGAPYATTFCTNNLRLAAQGIYTWVCEKDRAAAVRSGRYLLIILAFVAGAFFGALLIGLFALHAIWACCLLLAAVLVLLLWRR